MIISHRKKKTPDGDELTFEEMSRDNRFKFHHVILIKIKFFHFYQDFFLNIYVQ